MAIRVQCSNPQCRKSLDCPDEHAGKAVQCPACGTQVQVPQAGGPQVLGDYQLIRKLGQGGMAAVYEATQVRLQRRVALKVLPKKFTNDPDFLQRFYREARAAAALNHPNIVQVHDIAEDKGTHFFSMEYVDGESLQDRLKRKGKLPTRDALEIVENVAKALQYAHRHSIIHRDIKPDNIMLSSEGHVKLADLGLAKKMTDDRGVTQTGTGMGTPYYMAPEQAESAKDVDHRADIYALGITLLHLLTGKRPFEGDSGYAIAIAHATKELPTGEELGTKLPRGVESVIRKMCAKSPAERYQAYESLLEDLERAKEGKPTQAAMAGVVAGPAAAPAPASAPADVQASASEVSAASTVPASKRVPRKRVEKAPAKARLGDHPLLHAAAGAAAVVIIGIIAFFVLRPGKTTAPEGKVASAEPKPAANITEGKKEAPSEDKITTTTVPPSLAKDEEGLRTPDIEARLKDEIKSIKGEIKSLPRTDERDAETEELAGRAEELLGKRPEQLTAREWQSLRGLKQMLGTAWDRPEGTQPAVRWHSIHGVMDIGFKECGERTHINFWTKPEDIPKAVAAGKRVVVGTKFDPKNPGQWDGHVSEIRNWIKGNEDYIFGLYLPDEVYVDKFTPESLEALARQCRAAFPELKILANFWRAKDLGEKPIPEDIDYPMFEIYPFQTDVPQDDLKTLEEKIVPEIRALRSAATGRPLFLWLQACDMPGSKLRAPTRKEIAHLLKIVNQQLDVVGVVWFKWGSRSGLKGLSELPEAKAAIAEFGESMFQRLDSARKHLDAARGAWTAADAQKALSELQRAEALDRLNPEVHWELARAYAAQRKQEDAIRHFRQFVRLERAGERAEQANAFLASPAEKTIEHAEAWEQQLAEKTHAEAFGRFWDELAARMKRREFDKIGELLTTHKAAVDRSTEAQLLADAEMLKRFFRQAEGDLGKLKGTTIRIGGIAMKVADARDGKVYVKQGDAEMAWPFDRLDIEVLKPLGRSAAKDPKELAYQEMLLMVFFGDEKAAAKAISAAKEVGIDVSLYEARLAGAAPAGETTPQKAGLPASLASDFDVPKEPKDKHGNPIRKGSDKKTGMPLEIRHKQTGMHFVFIPAGEFLMGSPDNEKDREPGDAGREGPQHEARLTKPFYLGKYEVTQAEWKAVMANNPSAFQDDRNPVEHVYWHDCQAFLKKLNEQGRSARFSVSSEERAEARTTSLRFALPTEAQWEYACRAGTQTRFHFGDDLDYKQFTEYAWFKDNSGGTTHPVGEKKPNAWGLYDMNGNVWEWCEDWYGGYSANEVNDPPGPTTGSSRVYRGGSWLSPGANCRSAVRNHMAPGQRHSHVGCRVSLRPCP